MAKVERRKATPEDGPCLGGSGVIIFSVTPRKPKLEEPKPKKKREPGDQGVAP